MNDTIIIVTITVLINLIAMILNTRNRICIAIFIVGMLLSDFVFLRVP